MMFCRQCGAKVVEGTKFCKSCGNPITPVPPVAPTAAPAPVAAAPAPATAAATTPAPEPARAAPAAIVVEAAKAPQAAGAPASTPPGKNPKVLLAAIAAVVVVAAGIAGWFFTRSLTVSAPSSSPPASPAVSEAASEADPALPPRPVPEWKLAYYDYIKQAFGPRLGAGYTYFGCDVDGDGIPEIGTPVACFISFAGADPNQVSYYNILQTLKNGSVEPLTAPNIAPYGNVPVGEAMPIHASDILLNLETGEYIVRDLSELIDRPEQRGAEPSLTTVLYRRVGGEWARWREFACYANIDHVGMAAQVAPVFFREDGKETEIPGGEEDNFAGAKAFFEALHSELARDYTVASKSLPLGTASNWEEASPMVVAFLNSLDGYPDVFGDTPPVAPAWKQLYHSFLKEQLSSGGSLNAALRPAFYDLNNDGTPELWLQGQPSSTGEALTRIYTIRSGRVTPVESTDWDAVSGISGVYRDKKTGSYFTAVREYRSDTDFNLSLYSLVPPGQVSYNLSDEHDPLPQLFWREYAVPAPAAGSYSLDASYSYRNAYWTNGNYMNVGIDDSQIGHFLCFFTQEEAAAHFQAVQASFDQRFEPASGAALDLSAATTWAQAEPLVVKLLNSLDGRDDFYGESGAPATAVSAPGGDALTVDEKNTLYPLYIRHITKMIHDHASASVHQLASMAVGMEKAQPYVHALTPELRSAIKTTLPGVSFTRSITLEDLGRLLNAMMGSAAPTLTAGDFPASSYGAPIAKDPTVETFAGLGSYLVYDSATNLVLIGESELAQSAKALDLLRGSSKETVGQNTRITLDLLSFIICRGEYQNGGFVPTPGGSVFVALDSYGETVITREEFDAFFATMDYAKLLDLIRALMDKYQLRGYESTLVLEGGSAAASADFTVTQAAPTGGMMAFAPQQSSALEEPAMLAQAGQTYQQYYLSFLQAINALDGSLTSYCTENQRARQEERIFKFNADYTFQNQKILVDLDTLVYGMENGLPTVRFNVRCENDMWPRTQPNAATEKNVAHTEVILQQENDEWIVVYTHINNKMDFSTNTLDILYETLHA